MTAKATKAPPTPEPGGDGDPKYINDAEAEEIHYTPEEVFEKRLVPLSARKLRELAYRREIPHANNGNKIYFKLRHIRAINAMYDVKPIAEVKPRKPHAA